MEKLANAILLLTRELKRYNDAQLPSPSLKRSEAELGKAQYESPKEREYKELQQALAEKEANALGRRQR